MQYHPSTHSVQPSTEPTLIETSEGIVVTPRWMADVLVRVSFNHPVFRDHPTLWDEAS